ncbi:MAG: lipoate--protein ligase [Bacteroidota bacterium]
MYYIDSNSTDPFFNIAMEEYLIKQKTEEFIYSYINQPSVFVGKHQNAYAEVNMRFLMGLKIPVIRRISGGGTVYHDKGNLNFGIIKDNDANQKVDFAKQSEPIIAFLKTLGLNAIMGDKNELRIEGAKISGTAEHIYKNRMLHHGTLLFNSNIAILEKALISSRENYTDKSIPSNKTNVISISELLDDSMTMDEFKLKYKQYVIDYYNATAYKLSEDDVFAIEQLALEKYSTWEWNYGYSPNYILEKVVETILGDRKIKLEVEKGIIVSVKCENDIQLGNDLCDYFKGKQHRFDLFYSTIWDENLLSIYYQLF